MAISLSFSLRTGSPLPYDSPAARHHVGLSGLAKRRGGTFLSFALSTSGRTYLGLDLVDARKVLAPFLPTYLPTLVLASLYVLPDIQLNLTGVIDPAGDAEREYANRATRRTSKNRAELDEFISICKLYFFLESAGYVFPWPIKTLPVTSHNFYWYLIFCLIFKRTLEEATFWLSASQSDR